MQKFIQETWIPKRLFNKRSLTKAMAILMLLFGISAGIQAQNNRGNNINAAPRQANGNTGAGSRTAASPRIATYLRTNFTQLKVPSSGGNGTVNVYTDGRYRVTGLPEWCTLTELTHTYFRIACEPNRGYERSGVIRILSDRHEIRIDMVQAGSQPESAYAGKESGPPEYDDDSFNAPKGVIRITGLSLGYVSKQWHQKSGVIEYETGFWIGTSKVDGIQMGARIEPLFLYGFGINAGLFQELYFSSANLYNVGPNAQGSYSEFSINLPVDLEYRFNISPNFSLFLYGGLSLDLGIWAIASAYDSRTGDRETIDVYGFENNGFAMKRFNASYDLGGGIRINAIQLNAGISRGLLNYSSREDLTVRQNKPISISVSWMF